MSDLYYSDGYKYQVKKIFRYKLTFKIPNRIATKFFKIEENGSMEVHSGYAWDGATLFPNLKTIVKGSLIHDILYQCLRMELLPGHFRNEADRELKKVCKQEGMSGFLAELVYQGVNLGGSSAASPSNIKEIKVI